ncbi:hypothetical protein HK100_001738, partial [Physocladia obscura]
KSKTAFYLTKPTPILITRDPASNHVVIKPCTQEHTIVQIYLQTKTAILDCFVTISDIVHSDRLIYCLAGILFCASSPHPFGGSKSRPGYTSYSGTTIRTLLDFIVSSSYEAYWSCRGRHSIDAIINGVNRVLDLHDGGKNKRLTDELVLKGMNRASVKVSVISTHLQYTGVNEEELTVVYFTAREVQQNVDSESDFAAKLN